MMASASTSSCVQSFRLGSAFVHDNRLTLNRCAQNRLYQPGLEKTLQTKEIFWDAGFRENDYARLRRFDFSLQCKNDSFVEGTLNLSNERKGFNHRSRNFQSQIPKNHRKSSFKRRKLHWGLQILTSAMHSLHHLPQLKAKINAQALRCFLSKVLFSIASTFLACIIMASTPIVSHASTTTSDDVFRSSSHSSTGLLDKTNQPSRTISIQTSNSQPHSQHYSGSSSLSRRRLHRGRYSSNAARRRNYTKGDRQKVQRTSLLIVAATFLMSTMRATYRSQSSFSSSNSSFGSPTRSQTMRQVRTVTPFGIIRNQSPLGNGVSVMRVRMALEFDSDGCMVTYGANETIAGMQGETVGALDRVVKEIKKDGKKERNNQRKNKDPVDPPKAADAHKCLEALQQEENSFHKSIIMLAQQNLHGNEDFIRQKLIGNNLSNVASILLQNQKSIKYGSMDSVRVPFVEEAVREFRSLVKEERKIFLDQTQKQKLRILQQQASYTTAKKDALAKKFVLVTLLLTIKGDHTQSPFLFEMTRQQDFARCLARIATDAKVDGCVVGSEVLWTPFEIPESTALDGAARMARKVKKTNSFDCQLFLSEESVMEALPSMVPLK